MQYTRERQYCLEAVEKLAEGNKKDRRSKASYGSYYFREKGEQKEEEKFQMSWVELSI